MRNVLVILTLLVVVETFYGQKTPISFINNKIDKNKSKNLLGGYWDDKISEITLKNETEFVFWKRVLRTSCSTWRSYKGTWKKQNDTIIFSDQYEVMENNERFEFFERTKEDNYLLKFKTDKNSVLSNRKIKITFIYDFSADLDDVEMNMELENDFSLKIPFNEVPHLRELASIEYEYLFSNGEKRKGYITESKIIHKKEKELRNYIVITLIEKPKKETIYRTIKAVLEKNKLKIISKNKTKSDLPDYNGEIKFKEVYKIDKEE